MNRPDSLYTVYKWFLPVALLFSFILSSTVCAEGINFRGEYEYINSNSDTTTKATNQTVSSVYSQFKQQYNLDFSNTIYPYLTLGGGAFYELNNETSKSEGNETKTEETRLRPFVDLKLNNPIYKAGILYRRTQIENKTTGLPDTEDIQDEIEALVGWRPANLPELNCRYSFTHIYDDPATTDTSEKVLQLDSTYTLAKDINLNYIYRRTNREDTVNNFETLEQDHNGRVNYSHNFFNGRLIVNSGYRIHYNTYEVPSSENTESPILRSEGLSSLDNTPTDGPALDPNPALIDGNLTASAGLNIGRNGDQTTFVNIGLDFGFPVDVDKIYIWVDRRLSASVANSYSWSIYTSPDNLDTSTWTLQTTVFPAVFGTFDNRFEISFPSVNTRYIKVVTRPLSPATPGASSFPDIFVTEMEAYTTLPGLRIEKIDHNYTLDVRSHLTEKTVLGYNFAYLSKTNEEGTVSDKQTQQTHGVFARHIFNQIFSASSSFSRTDSKLEDENSVEYRYSGSIKADYWKAFRQILTYSARETQEDAGSSSTNAIFLRSNADIYKGWSALLDTGYSWSHPLETAPTTSTLIRAETNLIPNHMISINMNYAQTRTKEEGGGTADTTKTEYGFQAFFTPFRTLVFNFRLNVLDQNDTTSTLYNYSANWSPFPDGDLQFFFTYTETLRPEDEQKERTWGPSVKWSLNRHFYLDIDYNISSSESKTLATDSNSFRANLKIIF